MEENGFLGFYSVKLDQKKRLCLPARLIKNQNPAKKKLWIIPFTEELSQSPTLYCTTEKSQIHELDNNTLISPLTHAVVVDNASRILIPEIIRKRYSIGSGEDRDVYIFGKGPYFLISNKTEGEKIIQAHERINLEGMLKRA